MTEYGQVFREFRKDKGIALKDVAGDVLSVAQLSRFERGESDISLQKFIYALEKINLSIEDYMLVVRDFKRTESHELMSKLIPLYYAKDIKGFQNLQDEERWKMKESEFPLRYQLNIILLQGLICQLDEGFSMSQSDLDLVSDYLFQVELWGMYEVILLGNLYSFYPADYVYRMGREVFEGGHFKKELERHRHLLRIGALNFWLHCLEHLELEKAHYFKEKARSFLSSTKIYEKTVFFYTEGFELYQQGLQEEGKEKMQQAISIFDMVDAPEQVDYYQDHYRKFVKV